MTANQQTRPMALDLFCGLGGWTEGLLAEGYYVVGFDIERHEYGEHRYPGQLVIQDVLTIHGSQFKDAALIVASPPCQFFSYCAMPWTRAKQLAAEIRADPTRLEKELALFNACFRIQREACEAAGRHIPMVVENVRGAIPWVGRSRWNWGSFHFWGTDVPALMPIPIKRASKFILDDIKNSQRRQVEGVYAEGVKVPGFRFDGSGKSFQSASVAEYGDGIKCGGDWFGPGVKSVMRNHSSKSPARKMASAMIAKIPLEVSTWIARCFKPTSSLVQSMESDMSGSRPARSISDGRSIFTIAELERSAWL